MPTRRPHPIGAALAAALAVACSSAPPAPPPVLEPPVVELSGLGALGMLDFAAADELGSLASREFLAAIQSAQPGSPVLELGAPARVLAGVGGAAIDPETVRAIGEKHRVDALLVGELVTQQIQPRVSVLDLRSVAASAELEGLLSVRILETERGATLWTGSARTRVPVAQMTLSSVGLGSLEADDPQQARLALVRALVAQACADFEPRWVQP